MENRPLVSKTEMNAWLSAHGIGKRVPAVSGGTILLGSSRGQKTNKKDMWKEELMKKGEERSKIRVEISGRS